MIKKLYRFPVLISTSFFIRWHTWFYLRVGVLTGVLNGIIQQNTLFFLSTHWIAILLDPCLGIGINAQLWSEEVCVLRISKDFWTVLLYGTVSPFLPQNYTALTTVDVIVMGGRKQYFSKKNVAEQVVITSAEFGTLFILQRQ